MTIRNDAVPRTPNEKHKKRITKIISQLISSESIDPYRAACELHELKTWILFSNTAGEMPIDAGRRAALRFMEDIEKQYAKTTNGSRTTAAHLASLLKRDDFGGLYDHAIGRYGGLAALRDGLAMHRSYNKVQSRWSAADDVVKMMDYRFRYLVHHGENPTFSNIDHAFCLLRYDESLPEPAPKSPSPSPSTIKNHWRDHKQSEVFIYVAKTGFGKEREQFDLVPRDVMSSETFVVDTLSDAKDKQRLRRFFGACAYVAECFGEEFGWMIRAIPDKETLPRVAVETLPLSTAQLGLLERVKRDGLHHQFKDGK